MSETAAALRLRGSRCFAPSTLLISASCPAGQFLGRGSGLKLDGQRGGVHVVAASRHAKQHGLQPHRSLRRCAVDGPRGTAHPPRPPNNLPGWISTLWRQSWIFFFFFNIYLFLFLFVFDDIWPLTRSTVDSDEEETLFRLWLCELSPAHRRQMKSPSPPLEPKRGESQTVRLATFNRKLSILDLIDSSNIMGRRGTALIFMYGNDFLYDARFETFATRYTSILPQASWDNCVS